MKNICCAFVAVGVFLSVISQAEVPYASLLVSGNGVDEILSSFLSDPIRLPKSGIVLLSLLKKGKKDSIITSPFSEGEGLQPDKGTVFTGYSFELNRYGDENKEQSKTDGKSPPPQQEQQSKKQSTKEQGISGSSGSSGSGAASASASGNDKSHARHLEKLKEILKAAEKSLKTVDQKKNIDDFNAELEKLYEANPDILAEKGALENKQHRGKAILRVLQLYFPGKLERGEMIHVLLDYPGLRIFSIHIIKLFAKVLLPQIELPEGLTDHEFVYRLEEAANLDMRKLMHAYLGSYHCLHQLLALFITQLPLMTAEETKNYIFQDKSGHVSVVSIRRNSKGHYRFFFVDSLRTFKRYPEQTYSPMSHLVGLVLTLAIKYHGFTDSRFFFLPGRQVNDFGCESFMLHDLKTLLESPMLPQNGYYVDKEALNEDTMMTFFLQIMYLEGAEQLGRLVVNGEAKDFIKAADKPAFNAQDLDFFIATAIRTWKESGLEQDLVNLYQLRQFPLRFAHLTQGQRNLKRLLDEFPEESQEEVNQVIDETRGLLTVNDGACHNVNLAATLLWMKMNIDLLDMNGHGQEK
ncbi:hypothetical protein [Endozoicomonas sp. ALD040]|uniref:hypothetical protein n=1 Tax=unclassified Endozoicomonas TaxID=2644528 RepID=UPI003BB1A758